MAKKQPHYELIQESPRSWKVEKYLDELHEYDYFVYMKQTPDGKTDYLECDPVDDSDPDGWRCPASANGYYPCKHVKMVQKLLLQNGTDVSENKFLFTWRPTSDIIDNGGGNKPSSKERRPSMATMLTEAAVKALPPKAKEAYDKLMEARERGSEKDQRQARRQLRSHGIYLSKVQGDNLNVQVVKDEAKPADVSTKAKGGDDDEDDDEEDEGSKGQTKQPQTSRQDRRNQRRAS